MCRCLGRGRGVTKGTAVGGPKSGRDAITRPARKPPEEQSSIMTDDNLDLVWGAREIAKCINLKSAKQAFRLLESGQLPARKIGRAWVASRSALREHLIGAAPAEAERRRA